MDDECVASLKQFPSWRFLKNLPPFSCVKLSARGFIHNGIYYDAIKGSEYDQFAFNFDYKVLEQFDVSNSRKIIYRVTDGKNPFLTMKQSAAAREFGGLSRIQWRDVTTLCLIGEEKILMRIHTDEIWGIYLAIMDLNGQVHEVPFLLR